MLSKESKCCKSCATETPGSWSSSSSKRMLLQERPSIFNPKDHKHRRHLELWCEHQWDLTFVKSMKSKNTMYYHFCCDCFSRRTFARIAEHNNCDTYSLTKILSFKEVESAADLYRWLLKMLTTKASRGEKCYFPALNRYHFDENHLESPEERLNNLEFLQKRYEETSLELEKALAVKKNLEVANQQLLNSSKDWCRKYHEMCDSFTGGYPPEFYTPQKRQKLLNFEFSE